MSEAVPTVPLDSRSDIDPDVFRSMASLGCFKDRTALARALLSPNHNEEKVVYFLLLERKERQPSTEDDAQAVSSHPHHDPPRKRVDSATAQTSASLYLSRGRSQSIGSAGLDTSFIRQTRVNSVATPTYSPSAAGYYTYNPSSTPPSSRPRKTSYAPGDTLPPPSLTLPLAMSPQQPGSPWKRKLSHTMKTFMGSPRFHRRGRPDSPSTATPTSESPSPVMAKRSWFASLKPEREEVVVVHREKSLTELRSTLLQSFAVSHMTSHDPGTMW
jgi:BR serine/threonine kinase